jgi:hypothetical protein
VLAGLLSHELTQAAKDPARADYEGAPAAAPLRTSLPPPADGSAEPFVRVTTQLRLFIDAIQRAQGAFLAADPEWVQRHPFRQSKRTARRAMLSPIGG